MSTRGTIGTMQSMPTFEAKEKHTAESQWQYCGCVSCQEVRWRIETAPPGGKFDFDKFRHKDEKYPSRGYNV